MNSKKQTLGRKPDQNQTSCLAYPFACCVAEFATAPLGQIHNLKHTQF